MIKGLSQEITPRVFERGSRPERADRGGDKSFADQLLGGKAGELEGPDRTERSVKPKMVAREDKPGRESTRADKKSLAREDREGARSAERETDTEGDTRLRSSTSEMRKKLPKRPAPQEEPANDSLAQAADRMNVPRPVAKPIPSDRETDSESVEELAANPSAADGSKEFFPSPLRKTGVELASMQNQMAQPGQNLTGAPVPQVASKAETASETVQLIESMQAEQTGARQAALQEFVARMQNEVGVPPERLLSAFAEMDQDALMAPPEEAMESFLSNLDLNPDKEARAAQLYQSMVQTTGEAALSEKLVGLESGVNFEVLSPRDTALRDLNNSLNQLNTSFFMKGGPQNQANKAQFNAQVAAENMDAQLARMAQQQGKSGSSRNSDAMAAGLAMAGGMGAAKAGAETAAAASASGAEGASGLSLMGLGEGFASMPGLPGMGTGADAWAGEEGEGSFDGDASGQSMEGQAGGQNLASIQSMQREFASRLSTGDASAAKNVAKKAVSEAETAKIGSVASSGDMATPVVGMPTTTPAQPLSAAAAPAGFIIDQPKPTAQDEADNVRELIKQAQVMLKRGGGEMKLEMKPEGMGQVHLRVSVENGQVNVQMLTENDATKKLLETGLDELKANLAAHKLHVDQMKVDLGREIQKQMENNQQEANREQARQFAQDFMGSFRDERQGFRQSFAESGGLRSYGRAQTRAPLEAEPVVTAQAAAAKRASDSRRLNLVA